MVPEAHIVDGVPDVDGVSGPEGLTQVVEDGVDGRIGIVDQQIQFSFLAFFNFFEECFHFGIVGMVNLNRDANATPGLDFFGNTLKQLVGSS